MTIRAEDVDGMDVRVLAEAIGRECERHNQISPMTGAAINCPFADGLRAAVDRCSEVVENIDWRRTAPGGTLDQNEYERQGYVRILRAIARAMIAAGGKLETGGE